jgi:hypothetical protein
VSIRPPAILSNLYQLIPCMNRYNPPARPNSHMDEQSLYSVSGVTKANGGMKKPLLGDGNGGGTGENVELVTVPALGAE